MPSESESVDSSLCPIMVSGLEHSLGGVEEAPLLRSVTVVVASVPWRAPEEWRMEGEDSGKSITAAPACRIPVNKTVGLFFLRFFLFNFCYDEHRRLQTSHTIELRLRADTQPVGRSSSCFRPCSQVREGQSRFLQTWYDLTGWVAADSSATNRAGIGVVLSHRSEQQRDVVAFWSYHRVFRLLILGPAPR